MLIIPQLPDDWGLRPYFVIYCIVSTEFSIFNSAGKRFTEYLPLDAILTLFRFPSPEKQPVFRKSDSLISIRIELTSNDRTRCSWYNIAPVSTIFNKKPCTGRSLFSAWMAYRTLSNRINVFMALTRMIVVRFACLKMSKKVKNTGYSPIKKG